MQTTKEIVSYVKQKKKQGYEGYQDMLKYFSDFNLEQLDYLEIYFKGRKNNQEYLLTFREIITLFIAIIAVFVSVIPDALKNDVVSLQSISFVIISVGILALLLFYSIYEIVSTKNTIYETILEIIQKVKINHDN